MIYAKVTMVSYKDEAGLMPNGLKDEVLATQRRCYENQ